MIFQGPGSIKLETLPKKVRNTIIQNMDLATAKQAFAEIKLICEDEYGRFSLDDDVMTLVRQEIHADLWTKIDQCYPEAERAFRRRQGY